MSQVSWYTAGLFCYLFGAACRYDRYLWVQQEGAEVFHFGRRVLSGCYPVYA